ncbi:MAG: phosphotransferase, partial [Oscillospiraceae bacterium]
MIYDTITSRTLIQKGWSCDKKYCVTTTESTKYLLRITPFDKSDTRKELFDVLQEVVKFNIPMCKPVEFGSCDEGVYTIHTWINGKDAEEVIPLLPKTKQYVLGLKAGEILKKIHSIPALLIQEKWDIRFNKKIDRNIAWNETCVKDGFVIDNLHYLYDFVEKNRDLLKNRPQCFQHGDYHIGNMMISNEELVIIDFDRFDFGDPWEEFNRMTFNGAKSSYFATGLLNGYFNGEPPIEFFELQAFYIASTYLAGLSWARQFGNSEIDFTKNQVAQILSW